ncbi:MAG: GPR endopeptidase [Ruminococcaceae bacterium]|nr:GPR endopeptidase [Oscillospiraceae bacterium]
MFLVQLRTDLAIETPNIQTQQSGISLFTSQYRKARISRISVDTSQAATQIGRPVGQYVTVELPPLSDNEEELEDYAIRIGGELTLMLPENGVILVVGLGNDRITPDAVGPQAAARVLATRHIRKEFARSMGLDGLRPTAVAIPGVLGQTGMETAEVVRGLCDTVKPTAIIAIDALAAAQVSRLGCTVQLCDSGISPGSGVGNDRQALNRDTFGVPVIAIGVPTVVDARSLAIELTGDYESEPAVTPNGCVMMVTPREIDLVVRRAAQLIAMSVNYALQPDFSPRELMGAAL